MAEIFAWAGDGLSPGTFTTASAGTGDTAPDSLTGTGTAEIVSAGGRPPRIRISDTSAVQRYATWDIGSQTEGGGRFYFTPSAFPTSGNAVYILRLNDSGTARLTLDFTITGRFNLRDASSLLQQGPSGTIEAGQTYRIEWSLSSTGTASVVIYEGESTAAHVTLGGSVSSGAHDAVLIGHVTGGTGYTGTLDFDDILVTDTAELPGPVPPPIPTGTTTARGGRLTGTIPAGSTVARGGRILGSLPATFAVSIDSEDDLEAAEPGTTVTLTASATGGTVTSWAWSVDDEDVTITPDGDECGVLVPATLFGQNITVTATATGTGASPGSRSVVVSALPHNEWITTPTAWAPIGTSLI